MQHDELDHSTQRLAGQHSAETHTSTQRRNEAESASRDQRGLLRKPALC